MGFGRSVLFDMPLLEGYPHRFLRNVAPKPGLSFTGQVNPGLLVAIARGEYDAVVVHGYAAATTLGSLVGPRSRRTRVLLRSESTLLNRRPSGTRAVKEILVRALFARIDHFLAIGTKSHEYFRAYGVPPERITLAPYTVDNSWFEQRSAEARRDPAAARRKLGLPPERPLFLYCSKIIQHKRPLDVLSAFVRARPRAGLVYVGDGAQMQELRRRSREQASSATYTCSDSETRASCLRFMAPATSSSRRRSASLGAWSSTKRWRAGWPSARRTKWAAPTIS